MIARQPQMLQMSAVETGQMSSVETGQMSAVETGQMSAAETGQMSAVETSHFLDSGTGPADQNRQNIAQTPDQPPPAAAMLL